MAADEAYRERSPLCPQSYRVAGIAGALCLSRTTRLDRSGYRFADRFVGGGVAEHVVSVDDDGEAFTEPVPQAQPHALRSIESDDLDSDRPSEVPHEVLCDCVGAVRIQAHELRRLVEFLR